MRKYRLTAPQMPKKHYIYLRILRDINAMGNLLKIFLFHIFIKDGFYNSTSNYLRSLQQPIMFCQKFV